VFQERTQRLNKSNGVKVLLLNGIVPTENGKTSRTGNKKQIRQNIN
jgi:hypothetical protein